MFDEMFFDSNPIVVKETDGRHRLYYQATGELFLNFMGVPADHGGYETERQAISQATQLNTRLRIIRKMGGIKQKVIHERVLALALWLDGAKSVAERDEYVTAIA
ncbi:MAG: hypothetical protein H7837_05595 [Magnetococcus sp. MYC-9]